MGVGAPVYTCIIIQQPETSNGKCCCSCCTIIGFVFIGIALLVLLIVLGMILFGFIGDVENRDWDVFLLMLSFGWRSTDGWLYFGFWRGLFTTGPDFLLFHLPWILFYGFLIPGIVMVITGLLCCRSGPENSGPVIPEAEENS